MSKRQFNTFWTSDWHIGHEAVLEFDNRPFGCINEMQSALIKRYNQVVKLNDICYFLGDFSFASAEHTKDVVDQLNGTKIMVIGNHDRGMYAMRELGFDACLNFGSIMIGKNLVTFSHYPLLGIRREDTSGMKDPTENWHGEKKSLDKALPDFGQFHIHGHIHSPNNGQSKRVQARQLDVGVAANNYTPVSISQIESWIAQYTKNRIK